MDLTVVQRLTCPRGHVPTPLVARVDEVVNGRVQVGMLGCPVCDGEWTIAGGVARFGARATLRTVPGHDAPSTAALLALAEPGLVVVDGVEVHTVGELCTGFGALVLALDPEDPSTASAVIDGAGRVPLAAGIAAGVVLLRPERDAPFVASAAAVLRPAGRVLAAASLPIVAGLRELARDERFWVAERESDSVPVPIRRRET